MTAVEFLVKNITLYVSNENEYTFNKLFEIALEMEERQIIETWHNGYNNQSPMIDEENCGQQYFNETYKIDNP